MNDTDKIPQCESEGCNHVLIEGYCEMGTVLEERRMRLCFSCARQELALKRFLEEDDANSQR